MLFKMWLKILLQFVLSHIPKGTSINHYFQILRGSLAIGEIEARIPDLVKQLLFVSKHLKIEGSTIVEIGTGWEMIHAILLYCMGARLIYTYDHIRYANQKLVLRSLCAIANCINEIHLITSIPISTLEMRLERLGNKKDLIEMLQVANIKYIAPGDAQNTGLLERSINNILIMQS